VQTIPILDDPPITNEREAQTTSTSLQIERQWHLLKEARIGHSQPAGPSTAMMCMLYVLQAMLLSSAAAFSIGFGAPTRMRSLSMAQEFAVMVNGMPGPMALETARACLDRGFTLISTGFTGPGSPEEIIVDGAKKSQTVRLLKGPGVSDDAMDVLKALKAENPNLIVVDYTHPSAALTNIQTYIECDCDFVMGTTGLEAADIETAFEKGSNIAVVAPNMAKQIVAVQYAMLRMAEQFPSSFRGYMLKVGLYMCACVCVCVCLCVCVPVCLVCVWRMPYALCRMSYGVWRMPYAVCCIV
jgi:hypothetical protein